MERYGYKQIRLNNLKEIDENSKNFYNYKDLNFLCDLNNLKENIVFMFHGATSKNSAEGTRSVNDVIFRGYNYEFSNANVICISDFLLDKYKHYDVNWTLETQKYKSDLIYKEVIGYLINLKKKVLFTGTSAGGFPSVKFASFFNATALISNSQLYIENYYDNKGFTGFTGEDKIIYENELINKIILENNPKKIIYYQNKKDNAINPHSSYGDFLQFKKFAEDNNLDCEFNLFEIESKEGVCEHSIQFENNDYYLKINSFINI